LSNKYSHGVGKRLCRIWGKQGIAYAGATRYVDCQEQTGGDTFGIDISENLPDLYRNDKDSWKNT
jgi:hypothetical protein